VNPDPLMMLAAVEGVKAVLFFSAAGERVFAHPASGGTEQSAPGHWAGLLECVRPLPEAELVYDKAVLYTRTSAAGTLIVVTGLIAPSAIIRLNCDIVLQEVNAPQSGTGFLSRLKRKTGRLGGLVQLPELYENRD
jgi:hypothetical protein